MAEEDGGEAVALIVGIVTNLIVNDGKMAGGEEKK